MTTGQRSPSPGRPSLISMSGCAEDYPAHPRDTLPLCLNLPGAESDGRCWEHCLLPLPYFEGRCQHTHFFVRWRAALRQGQGIGSAYPPHLPCPEQGGRRLILGTAYYSAGFVPAEPFVSERDEHYRMPCSAGTEKRAFAPAACGSAGFDMKEQQIAIFEQGFPRKRKKAACFPGKLYEMPQATALVPSLPPAPYKITNSLPRPGQQALAASGHRPPRAGDTAVASAAVRFCDMACVRAIPLGGLPVALPCGRHRSR